MDAQEMWQRYRDWLCVSPELGFRLDVSRSGLTDGYVEKLAASMDAALESMRRLEGGAVANPDEQRRVGHYWLRAPELAPEPEIGAAIDETREALLRFAAAVHDGSVRPTDAERFRRLLVIGIGGSALGPRFVAEALGGESDRMAASFLDNTDPDGIDRTLGRIGRGLAETLTLVISKSGGTPETRNGMLEARAAYERQGLDFARHAVAITQPGSRLDRVAVEQGFLARFPMWDWVGGRTSELSVVGLLPAALQGIDVREMLAGAAAMDEMTRRAQVRANPAALLALAWHSTGAGRGDKSMVILPYKDRLALFSRYLQQLVMESLGKERDLDGAIVHQGIAVYGNKGSTDQHAYVQQLRDGRDDFFVTFIEVLRDREGAGIEVEGGATSGDFLQGFLIGTRQALFDSGRASITITVDRVDARSVGLLIALYERAVGLYAYLVNVNAYHQPGVEAGKRAAAEVLELQRAVLRVLREREGGSTAAELAEAAGHPGDVEIVYMLLERLAANPERGVTRTSGPDPFSATYRI